MKLILVILLLQLGVLAYDAHHSHPRHECIHEKKMKNHKIQIAVHDSISLPLKISSAHQKQSGLRPLQKNHKVSHFGVNFIETNMQIQINFDWTKQFVNSRPYLKAQYEVSARILQTVRYYFEGILKVSRSIFPSIRPMTCDKLNIPAFSMYDFDLYVGVQPESDDKTSYFAAAMPCALTNSDLRPIVGTFIINFAFIKVERLYQYLYFSTFAHEFTHILGFSQKLFHYYIDPMTSQQLGSVTTKLRIQGQAQDRPNYSEEFTAITLKAVVDYARKFYGCNSIQGVPLENNGDGGSANSHWEKLFLPSEYMNPTIENPGRISEFTLNLLRGTGWYLVDSRGAQSYDWNQGVGCGHFSICPRGRGYCDKSAGGAETCSIDYDAKVNSANEGILHHQR
jgi:hypothetical protein